MAIKILLGIENSISLSLTYRIYSIKMFSHVIKKLKEVVGSLLKVIVVESIRLKYQLLGTNNIQVI